MNGRVTHRAGLILLGLVMERWSCGSRRIHRERVALQAEQVYVAALQQPRVRRTVGGMAGDAAFSLDGGVFPGKGTGLVRVAVEADLVLCSGGTQLVLHKAAMLVVAVTANNQAFIHAMVEGLGEIRLYFKVAAITKAGLCRFQKPPVDLWRMH